MWVKREKNKRSGCERKKCGIHSGDSSSFFHRSRGGRGFLLSDQEESGGVLNLLYSSSLSEKFCSTNVRSTVRKTIKKREDKLRDPRLSPRCSLHKRGRATLWDSVWRPWFPFRKRCDRPGWRDAKNKGDVSEARKVKERWRKAKRRTWAYSGRKYSSSSSKRMGKRLYRSTFIFPNRSFSKKGCLSHSRCRYDRTFWCLDSWSRLVLRKKNKDGIKRIKREKQTFHLTRYSLGFDFVGFSGMRWHKMRSTAFEKQRDNQPQKIDQTLRQQRRKRARTRDSPLNSWQTFDLDPK